MAKLNGIEIPTPCRMVLVRCGKLVSMGSAERPAIVLAERNLTPRLYVLPYDTFTSSFIGAQSNVLHESLLSNDDETTWCWRWPPREEQPAAVVTAPVVPQLDWKAKFEALAEEHEKARAIIEETKKQLAANDAHHVEQFAAETRRATALSEEVVRLRAALATLHNATLRELETLVTGELQKLREQCHEALQSGAPAPREG